MKACGILALVILILLSCNLQDAVDNPADRPKISFKVDSLKRYDLDGNAANEFIFSPLEFQDKIWLTKIRNGSELNLKDGSWQLLKEKYTPDFKYQIREEHLWTDPLTKHVFIAFPRSGLLEYDGVNDSFRKWEVKYATALLFEKDNIFIGNNTGLYQIVRGATNVKRLENFPLKNWVQSITRYDQEILSINNGALYYNLSLKKVVSIGHKPKLNDDVPDRTFYKNKLPNYQYQLIESDSLLWLYANDLVFWTPDSTNYYRAEEFLTTVPRDLIVTKDYIFLLFKEEFTIVNKQYWIGKSERFDNQSYQKRQADFNKEIQKLNRNDISLSEMLQTIQTLEGQRESNFAQGNKLRYASLPHYIMNVQRNERLRRETTLAIEQNKFPEKYLPYALFGMCKYYALKSDFHQTKKYINLLNIDSAKEEFMSYPLGIVNRFITAMDSLDEVNMPIDQRTYQKILLQKDLWSTGWYGESWIDNSQFTSALKQFLKNHAQSPYCADADWELIQQKYAQYEVADVIGSERIESLNKFVQKYPNSNLTIQAMMEIARQYALDDNSSGKRIVHLKKGLAQVERIKNSFAEIDSTTLTELVYLERDLREQWLQANFEFEISGKEFYGAEEEIVLQLRLKNISNEPLELVLYKGIPWAIHVGGAQGELEFVKMADVESERQRKIFSAKEELLSTIELTDEIRRWEKGAIGQYKLQAGNQYFVNAFTPDLDLRSNRFQFYIDPVK